MSDALFKIYRVSRKQVRKTSSRHKIVFISGTKMPEKVAGQKSPPRRSPCSHRKRRRMITARFLESSKNRNSEFRILRPSQRAALQPFSSPKVRPSQLATKLNRPVDRHLPQLSTESYAERTPDRKAIQAQNASSRIG